MCTEYGIICELTNEAKIVKNVNAFLKRCDFRKMYKWPDDSIKQEPFEIDHYYTQFLKADPGGLFDIRPNYDKSGRIRFDKHPECGWTIFTKPFREFDDQQNLSKTEAFFKALCESVGFPVIELHRYTKDQERILS